MTVIKKQGEIMTFRAQRFLLYVLLSFFMSNSANAQQSRSVVGKGTCKINRPSNIVSPYKGGCKDGLAEGQGSYSYLAPTPDGDKLTGISGEFRHGELNGNATVTMPESVSKGEFREGRAWNTIVRGVDGKGVRYVGQVRDGVPDGVCRADAREEKNCIDRLRKLLPK